MGKLEQTVRSIYGAMEDPEMKDFSKLEAFLRPLFADDCEWEKFPTRNYAQACGERKGVSVASSQPGLCGWAPQDGPHSLQEAGVPWVARRSGVDKALEHFKDLQQVGGGAAQQLRWLGRCPERWCTVLAAHCMHGGRPALPPQQRGSVLQRHHTQTRSRHIPGHHRRPPHPHQQALAISRFHVVRMAEVEDRTLLVWLDFEGTNLRTGEQPLTCCAAGGSTARAGAVESHASTPYPGGQGSGSSCNPSFSPI